MNNFTFISPDQLALIEARCEKATPGPWRSMIEGRDHTSGSSFIMTGPENDRGNDIELSGTSVEDQDFIAHARQDIPLLVEQVKKMRKFLDEKTYSK